MIEYFAEFKKQEGRYSVEFPDLAGCLTEGDTLEEAQSNAQEALSVYLESLYEHNQEIPKPKVYEGKGYCRIQPNLPVGFALWLKWIREKRHLKKAELSQKLGITFQTYQQLERVGKANPTLKTVQRVQRALEEKFF